MPLKISKIFFSTFISKIYVFCVFLQTLTPMRNVFPLTYSSKILTQVFLHPKTSFPIGCQKKSQENFFRPSLLWRFYGRYLAFALHFVIQHHCTNQSEGIGAFKFQLRQFHLQNLLLKILEESGVAYMAGAMYFITKYHCTSNSRGIGRIKRVATRPKQVTE